MERSDDMAGQEQGGYERDEGHYEHITWQSLSSTRRIGPSDRVFPMQLPRVSRTTLRQKMTR